MISINKVVPRIYDYLKVAGKSSVLQTKPKELLQFKELKLDCDKFEFVRHSADEIEKAYKEYANSPYINVYLRQQTPLSQKSNNIVSCLKQAIRESEPVTGKFYRGLSNCADEEGVRKFIFNNKGFTSVAPEYNKSYANSFALGRGNAIVEFDLKTPIKAYNANSYETIFDTNVFTADKFDLVKVKDNYYRVTEKLKAPANVHPARISSHIEESETLQFGCIPNDYVNIKKEFVPEHAIVVRFGPDKGKTKVIPAHWDEYKESLPYYHIDELWSGGKGSGTAAVQNVVEKSLSNPLTKGRVMLDASSIDGKTHPAGFYYKLGFRYKQPAYNQELEAWLANGGKRENSPMFPSAVMYLPKENIEHCLNYGKNK